MSPWWHLYHWHRDVPGKLLRDHEAISLIQTDSLEGQYLVLQGFAQHTATLQSVIPGAEPVT